LKGKLTLSIPPEKVKQWKFAALEQDMSVSELVEKAMDEYLKRVKEKKAHK